MAFATVALPILTIANHKIDELEEDWISMKCFVGSKAQILMELPFQRSGTFRLDRLGRENSTSEVECFTTALHINRIRVRCF